MVVSLVRPRGLDVRVFDEAADVAVEGARMDVFERFQLPSGHLCMEKRRWKRLDGETPPTDAAGHTRVEGIVPGAHLVLEVSKPGYLVPRVREGYESGVRVPPGVERIELALSRLDSRDVCLPVIANGAMPREGSRLSLRRSRYSGLRDESLSPGAAVVR